MTNKQLSLFIDMPDIQPPDNGTITEVPVELRSETDNYPFLLFRGNVFKQRGFTILAKNDYKKALELAPDEPAPAWHLGIMAYEDGQLHKAKYWLVKAIARLSHPSGNNRDRLTAQQFSLLKVFSFFTGIICIRLGDTDQGIMYLQGAIEPGFEGSYVAIQKAISLFDSEKEEEAINFLKSELKRKDPVTFARLQKMTTTKDTRKISDKV
jgi:tetratricopeptide (TPR) repeat protein